MIIKNKTLSALYLCIPLLFSGCYNVEKSQETPAETPSYSSVNDYQSVIASLDGKASSIEEYMLLAAAYMAKSGVTLDDVMGKICNSSTSDSNSFMSFVGSVDDATQMCPTSLEDVNKATDYYMLIIGNRCETPEDLNSFEKNVCLYKGLAQTLLAANTINYITNASLTPMESMKKEMGRLKASTCAMQYAKNGKSGDCSISPVDTISFPESNRKYERIAVYSNGKEFEFLLTDDPKNREVVVTNGFCTLDDFTTRFDYSDLSKKYFACPISTTEDEPEVTISNDLIDAFNAGTSTIVSVTDSNSELSTSVSKFQEEIQIPDFSSESASTNANLINFDSLINSFHTEEVSSSTK
jgi:hypothetical protein